MGEPDGPDNGFDNGPAGDPAGDSAGDSGDNPDNDPAGGTAAVRAVPRNGKTRTIRGRLAAYGLLFFTVLSLYASPEALFWYPIPVFLSLPLFTALPFLGGRTESESNGPLPTTNVR